MGRVVWNEEYLPSSGYGSSDLFEVVETHTPISEKFSLATVPNSTKKHDNGQDFPPWASARFGRHDHWPSVRHAKWPYALANVTPLMRATYARRPFGTRQSMDKHEDGYWSQAVLVRIRAIKEKSISFEKSQRSFSPHRLPCVYLSTVRPLKPIWMARFRSTNWRNQSSSETRRERLF